MKVILGLGNPGRAYERTRHNAGWWVLDYLVSRWDLGPWKRDGQSLLTSGRVMTRAVRLVKPQTFMNLSGAALVQYLRRPAWDPASDLLVMVDDVALPLGRYRLRARGSSGGHNGLRSIEQAIGGREYARLRIGIGPTDPERQFEDLTDFVLGKAGKDEREMIDALMPSFANAAEIWLQDGIERAMSAHNSEPQTP